jgi:hypothetical protein
MKIKEFLTKWAWQIFAGLFFLLYLGKGCTSTKVSKTNSIMETEFKKSAHKIDSLSKELNNLKESTATRSEVRDEKERVMLNFLIYKDDLDKGKTSLSKIKDKIELND